MKYVNLAGDNIINNNLSYFSGIPLSEQNRDVTYSTVGDTLSFHIIFTQVPFLKNVLSVFNHNFAYFY